MSMADRYRTAWDCILQALPVSQQEEIRSELKANGKLSNSKLSNDFVSLVCKLAESDKPLPA